MIDAKTTRHALFANFCGKACSTTKNFDEEQLLQGLASNALAHFI